MNRIASVLVTGLLVSTISFQLQLFFNDHSTEMLEIASKAAEAASKAKR